MNTLNIINDLIDIIKNNKRHNVKITIDTSGVTVYLDDDPDETYEEKYVIPVKYDTLYECCHIPHDEYIESMSNDTAIGIDKEEIELIQKIMEYLENNKSEVQNICNILSVRYRKDLDNK
ncbi:hypothetical protein H8S37_03985 [Mediterraneibacter sp. NSJ-55]|uniref:Uncharacterized protein n=1 Tax=Mediterraneibacter hominis TaxID=2763054 RepID=A0A923LG42_9FIRM|nr:hypothetical protein [Mediterraneibacter hominis]MBC5688093.1 hypothetical protein [Mediterraneibacter hominis]